VIRRNGNGNDEIVIHVFAVRHERVRALADNEVRRAEAPVALPFGDGRQVRGIPFERAFLDPF